MLLRSGDVVREISFGYLSEPSSDGVNQIFIQRAMKDILIRSSS